MPARCRNRSRFWTAALAAAALVLTGVAVAAGPAQPAAADPVPATVFGSFESAASTQSVTINDPTHDRVRWSTDVVSAGSHSLEYDVAAGTGTPQMDLYAGSSFDSIDWTGHKILAWDVMSDSPNQFLGQVTVKDTAGHSWGHAFYIPPFGYHPFDAYVADVAAAGVDITHISQINMSLPRQQNKLRLWVDTMRVVDIWPYDHSAYLNALTPGLVRQMRLPQQVAEQRLRLRVAEALIPRRDDAADRALRAQAASIGSTLDGLAATANRTDLDLVTAQGVFQQVRTLSGTVSRLQQVVLIRRLEPSDQYGLVTADSMSLVFPQDRPCTCSIAPSTLKLARGEYQNEQVAVLPYAEDLHGLTVRVASVSGPGSGAGLHVSADPVGFLNTTPTDAYKFSRDPAGWYTGWTPDPIRTDLSQVDVPAGKYQPYWVGMHADPDAPAGRYTVRLDVSGPNVAHRSVSLPVEVWPFTLPDRPDLTTSFEFQPTILQTLYQDADPSARIHQYEDFLETYKMEPGNIYTPTPPTVADLLRVKEKWGLRHFNVLYLNGTLFNLKDPSSWQPQIDTWITTISDAMAQYKAAGLDKLAYVYGFDEATSPYYPVMKQTLGQLKAKFPDLKVMSTLRDPSMGPDSGLDAYIDIWAPQQDIYRQTSADAAQARGDQAYWYPDIATGHPYPNWFNGYPPIDTRMLMGPMSHQSGVDGVLYYNVDRWINHPLLTDGIYSSWNPATFDTTAGDGSLLYPGKDGPLPSMRLANFRDGMQDYNLLGMLADRIAHAGSQVPANELARARDLLGAQAVVRNDTDYTEDPATYRHWRDQVAAEIVTLS